jgi:hypothetical protein
MPALRREAIRWRSKREVSAPLADRDRREPASLGAPSISRHAADPDEAHSSTVPAPLAQAPGPISTPSRRFRPRRPMRVPFT